MISIYGIFKNGRCLYVGRTANPTRRAKAHKTRFGKSSELRVLEVTRTLSSARKLEAKYIKQFIKKGQARSNGRCHTSAIISPSTYGKLKRFAKKNGMRLRYLFNLAVETFLEQETKKEIKEAPEPK
jgi:predicted GIY-YIG superfamily endonuclease